MRLHRDERGQTIILVALSLPLMLGFVGIATDVGSLLHTKRQLQTAADDAALAGALALAYSSSTSAYDTAGKAASAANGFSNGSNGVIVKMNNGPQFPGSPYLGQAGYIEAVVSQNAPTIFLSLFGFSTVKVGARAVATLGAGTICAYTLGANGDDVNINNASLSFTNCGLMDDSSDSNALTVASGSHLTAGTIGIVSSSWTTSEAPPGTLTPASPTIGIVPESNPLSHLDSSAPTYDNGGCQAGIVINTSGPFTPTSTCYNGITFGGGATVTLNNPGGVLVINGDLNIANGANVTLGSGLYYITGALLGQAGTTITGSGVTFYMTGTNISGGAGDPPEINLANGVNLNLTAPNTPTSIFNGMLFWQLTTDVQPIIIAAGPNATLKGAIYAPDAQLSLSTGVSTNIYVDLVVNSLLTVGGSTINSYESLGSSITPVLRAPVLVE